MLNYRNTLVTFCIVVVIILAVDFVVPVSLWIYAGIVLVFVALLAWGSISIQSGFYLTSVCRGDCNLKAVAFTFDDGPDEQITPLILDVLKENNVKATFFIVGSKAEKHPEIAKRIALEGHIIGSHSYSHHFFFDLFSTKSMKNELKKTANIVFTLTGRKIRLFRPPYGVTNPNIARAIKAMQYQSVGWSLKSNDTAIHDDSLLLKNLTSEIKKGDIVLFHDNQPGTLAILGNFIHFLHEREFEISRLDKFINCKPYVN